MRTPGEYAYPNVWGYFFSVRIVYAVNHRERRCRNRSLTPVCVALTKRAPDDLTLPMSCSSLS